MTLNGKVAPAVKWGILSTAHINRKVIPGAHASEKVELIAVASRDLGRAEEYAREWEIERAYGSYEALLEDADVEAVYLAAEHAALRVVDPRSRCGKARALREADEQARRRRRVGIRRC